MSTIPVLELTNIFPSIEAREHSVPSGAVIQNYGTCSICSQPYLLDCSGSDICGREFCRSIRATDSVSIASKLENGHILTPEWWQKQTEAEREMRKAERERRESLIPSCASDLVRKRPGRTSCRKRERKVNRVNGHSALRERLAQIKNGALVRGEI